MVAEASREDCQEIVKELLLANLHINLIYSNLLREEFPQALQNFDVFTDDMTADSLKGYIKASDAATILVKVRRIIKDYQKFEESRTPDEIEAKVEYEQIKMRGAILEVNDMVGETLYERIVECACNVETNGKNILN